MFAYTGEKKLGDKIKNIPTTIRRKTVEGIKNSPKHIWENKKRYFATATLLMLIYTNIFAVGANRANNKIKEYLGKDSGKKIELQLNKDTIDLTKGIIKAGGKVVWDGTKWVYSKASKVFEKNEPIILKNTKNEEFDEFKKKVSVENKEIQKTDEEIQEARQELNSKKVPKSTEQFDPKLWEMINVPGADATNRERNEDGVPIYSKQEVLEMAKFVAEKNFPSNHNIGQIFQAVVDFESGGGEQFAKSVSDITGEGVVFSVGAVQVNLTNHDIYLLDGSIIPAKDAFEGQNYTAKLVNKKLYEKAVIALSDPRVAFLNAMIIAKRFNLGQWGAYSSGKYIEKIPINIRPAFVERHNRIWGTNLGLIKGRVVNLG